MATTKIKDLPETTNVSDTDHLIIEDTSTTLKTSVQAFISYLRNHTLLKDIFVNKDTIGQKNGIAPLNNNAKLDPAYINYGKTTGTCYSGNDGYLLEEALSTHEGDTSNPHQVSKEQLGLGKTENKSSADIRNELTAENISDAIGYVPEIQGAYENATAYTDMRLGELTGGTSGLSAPVKINGVDFDGTEDITIRDDTKAPISHAVTSTEYGVGDTTKYGHVKVDNALSSTSTNPVQNKAIADAISELNTNLTNVRIETIIKYGNYASAETVGVKGVTAPSTPNGFILISVEGASANAFVPCVPVSTSRVSGGTDYLYNLTANSSVGNVLRLKYIYARIAFVE